MSDEAEHSKRDADLSHVEVVANDETSTGAGDEAAAETSSSNEAEPEEVKRVIDPAERMPRPRRASRMNASVESEKAGSKATTDSAVEVVAEAGEEGEGAAAKAEGDNADWAGEKDAADGTAAADDEDLIISGWLKKAGEKNTKFKDRFFVIDGDIFRYYTDDKSYDDGRPPIKNNSVPIPQYTCQAVSRDKSEKRLQLVPREPTSATFGNRTWTFEAHDTTARDYWIKAFQDAGAAKPLA